MIYWLFAFAAAIQQPELPDPAPGAPTPAQEAERSTGAQNLPNAQTFINQLASRGGLTLWLGTDGAGNDQWNTNIHTKIVTATSNVSCATAFQQTLIAKTDNVTFKPENNTIIDWSKISSVEASGKNVSLSGPAIPPWERIIVTVDTPAFATRLAYAMEFIRSACDTTVQTGF